LIPEISAEKEIKLAAALAGLSRPERHTLPFVNLLCSHSCCHYWSGGGLNNHDERG
jgi:hypothetical protein